MAQAIFVSGTPNMVPYTPSGAVTAGDVIVEGSRVYIAHHDIAAEALGSVASGGGIYDFLATSGDEIAMGDPVYWDDSANVAEESATSNQLIGSAVKAKIDGETTVRVQHGLT